MNILQFYHCITTIFRGSAKYVLLGDLDYAREDDDSRPLLVNIAERVKHPQYTSKFKYNDIALFRLDISLKFTEYVRPACLPELSKIGFTAVATGWGRLDYNRPLSTHLQKVELDLYTHQECDDLYAVLDSRYINKGIANDTQLCAGTYSGRGDTCQVISMAFLKNFYNSLNLNKICRAIAVVLCKAFTIS